MLGGSVKTSRMSATRFWNSIIQRGSNSPNPRSWKQAIQGRRSCGAPSCVEQAVWTECMLTRLEQSEPTTKWFRLWDKVLDARNLQAAFWSVWRNAGAPGVDGQSVRQFDAHAEAELARLREELHSRRYRRQPARRAWIPKPGTTERRPLGIPAVRDRTVEAAGRHVLEPVFERDFAEHSYGFRPGRGCREAVGRVEELLGEGRAWCVDVDLKSFVRYDLARSVDGAGAGRHVALRANPCPLPGQDRDDA
ncbi:MAG: hypothetical protein HY736_08355 [Verrucomicrobia bacterium]|nr:hypothetical protein [Verrucomicrobiota bacterium]